MRRANIKLTGIGGGITALFSLLCLSPAYALCNSIDIYHDASVCVCPCAAATSSSESGTSITLGYTQPSETTVTIVDLNGTLVRTLIDHEPLMGAVRTFQWDGTDNNGNQVPEGKYRVITERADGFNHTVDLQYQPKKETVFPQMEIGGEDME